MKNLITKYPSISYFVLTFTISWIGAFLLVAPRILKGQAIPKMDGILMFPIMLLGPAATGIGLTIILDGKLGFRKLLKRMSNWRVAVKWFLIAMALPPVLIIIVLIFLSNFVSPVFSPNFFPFGLLFGIPAGFFEEIGWSGFAFPKMRLNLGFLKAAMILGILWGLWHLPVIDFLGAASPHGLWLFPFALSFIAAMCAMRIIIVWMYANTNSVLLAQIMHIFSTGSLVIFGPSKVSPEQETLWYAVYAFTLWVAVLVIFWHFKKGKNVAGNSERTHHQITNKTGETD